MSQEHGDWVEFAVGTLARVVEEVRSLEGGGWEVVERRAPGFREDDPEIIRVDKVAEAIILNAIEEAGIEAIVLSEEAGRVCIKPSQPSSKFPEPVYVVVDPFDGSMLYRRRIPAFWYSSLSVYSLEGSSLCAAVVNILNGEVDFANENGSFTGSLVDGGVKDVSRMMATLISNLSEAYLESYFMKPSFLYPALGRLEPLFRRCKFLLPNGGPAGWADVAKGRVDAYIALNEPATEVFTGLPIAERAGAEVTTLRGGPVTFKDDLSATYSIVCSNGPALHQEILDVLATCEL